METLWSAEEWEPVEVGRVPTLRAPATTEAEQVAGMEVEVVRSAKRRKSVSARIVDGRIVIRMPQWMTKAQEREYVESLVAKLVRQHTAKAVDLPARARELARRYDLPEPEVDPLREQPGLRAGVRARRRRATSASATASPASPAGCSTR